MAAANVYNTNVFESSSSPKPKGLTTTPPLFGWGMALETVTVATTSLDDAGDFVGFFTVPEGSRIGRLEWDVADPDTHATPTLDADIILRVFDKDGTATDTVLFNAGTTFQAASQDWMRVSQRVSGSAYGYGIVGIKVVAAAATGAAVAWVIGASWE